MRMRRWIVRSMKVVLAGGLVLVLVAGAWLVTRPGLPDGHLDAAPTIIVDEAFRAAADRSLPWIHAVADSLGLPSISVAAAADGDVVWQVTLGYGDLAGETPATPATPYRTGSIAKAITSVVLGRLVEEGHVDLDEPVSRYLPQLPAAVGAVTLRQLAGHMGGVRNYVLEWPAVWHEQLSQRHYQTATEALPIFIDDPLLFTPGRGFTYSTHGYTLLSAGLEGATGTPFLELLSSRVTGPLRLSSTGPDDLTTPPPGRATTYIRLAGRYVDPYDADVSYKWAGGGMLSTPADLVRLASDLMAGSFLRPATVEALWTPQLMPDGEPNPQAYGMGWRSGEESELLGMAEPTRVVHHGGSIAGGSSFLLLLPEHRVAVAVMTNLSVGNAAPLRRAAFRVAGAFAADR